MLELVAMAAHAATREVPVLQARGLSVSIHGQALLHSVELDVQTGRRLVLMGANGAGKSLLLRTLHGLVPPAQGSLLWRGRPMDRVALKAQAMVFQRPVLLRRSVRSNIRFALRVRGLRGAELRTREDDALHAARLDHLSSRPARVLSGGEQQRLAVARALACDPQVLFMDEPTASLDPASTQAIEHQICSAHAAGVTIVLVTHDLGQARRMADDVAFLHAGRVVEKGPAERMLSNPSSAPAQAWLDGRLYIDTPT